MSTNSLIPEGSPLAGLPTSFRKLTETASELNAASDDLTKVVELLDAALRKLNLGVSGWVDFDGWSDEHQDHQTDQIGYTKVGDKWGLAIKRVIGNYNYPEDDTTTLWLFNEANREFRIKAIGSVPKLVDELDKLAKKMTAALVEKTKEARLIALAIHSVASQNGGK